MCHRRLRVRRGPHMVFGDEKLENAVVIEIGGRSAFTAESVGIIEGGSNRVAIPVKHGRCASTRLPPDSRWSESPSKSPAANVPRNPGNRPPQRRAGMSRRRCRERSGADPRPSTIARSTLPSSLKSLSRPSLPPSERRPCPRQAATKKVPFPLPYRIRDRAPGRFVRTLAATTSECRSPLKSPTATERER